MFAVVLLPGMHWKAVQRVRGAFFTGKTRNRRRTSSVTGKSQWQRVPKHAASPSDLARTRANGDRARRKL